MLDDHHRKAVAVGFGVAHGRLAYSELVQATQPFEQGAWPLLLDTARQFRKKKRHSAPLAAEVILNVRVVTLTGKDDQILDRVIGTIAIFVMDHFAGRQRPAQDSLRENPVQLTTSTCTYASGRGVIFCPPYLESPPVAKNIKSQRV